MGKNEKDISTPTSYTCLKCLDGNHHRCSGYYNATFICNCAITEANTLINAQRPLTDNRVHTLTTLRAVAGLPPLMSAEDILQPTTKSVEEVNKRADILRTAESLINGDRADTYGPPEISFGRIANLWNAMGFVVIQPGRDYEPLNAVDVALALQQLKISRIISSPDHEDSWVDNAGYAALGGEMAVRKKGVKDE